MDDKDHEYWYARGVRDATRGKIVLKFRGDEVPADWSEEDRKLRQEAYDEGFSDAMYD